MNLPISFHRAATAEFIEASAWYEERQLGLAAKFMAEIERCVSLASEHPFQYAIVHDPDHSYSEERYLLFGVSSKDNYLVVSFTERSETIRIISARQMTRQERNTYEQ